ncbi:hypothetical protein PINS_up013807 [Pythium insidiosum]|nr:hypothetical protein PINS_up013807 [Pythium insidiosum]
MGICGSQPLRSPRNSSSAGVPTALLRLVEMDETRVLGQGAYASVVQGKLRAPPHSAVAIKRLERHPTVSIWEDEARLLRLCGPHANIVGLHHVVESAAHVYLVLDLAEGGELFQALISEGAYSEWDARRFTRDMLEALRVLQDKGVVHRDIKPENLLLTSTDPAAARIQLCDFGSAKMEQVVRPSGGRD